MAPFEFGKVIASFDRRSTNSEYLKEVRYWMGTDIGLRYDLFLSTKMPP